MGQTSLPRREVDIIGRQKKQVKRYKKRWLPEHSLLAGEGFTQEGMFVEKSWGRRWKSTWEVEDRIGGAEAER